MANSSQKSTLDCSPANLQEYLDGELSVAQEHALETHMSSCVDCLNELNLHKAVLGVLDREGVATPEIPGNFASVIAARADSQVIGLRRRNERIAALAVAGALVLSIVVLLAFDLSQPLAAFESVTGSIGSFVVLLAGLLADIAIGIFVVVKVAAFQTDRLTAIVLFAVLIGIGLFSVWAVRSGRISSLREIKR